jgi:hypothetical protein
MRISFFHFPVRPVVAVLFVLATTLVTARAEEWRGAVVDGRTGQAIANAVVTLGDNRASTDGKGQFAIQGKAESLQIRAQGYARLSIREQDYRPDQPIALPPLQARGLYLSIYGISVSSLREPALRVIGQAGLNSVVIDMKDDRGLIPYPSSIELAGSTGALKIRTIKDLGALVAGLKARGLYTIARIVVFKDTLLAHAKPEWAIRNAKGALYKDREGLAWVDPFHHEAWDYSLRVAEEAAASGFDEIQFDYLRFPDAGGISYSQTSTQATRIAAITGYLSEARRRLQPYNVFLTIDVFGYVCWNSNDTKIGQRLEDLANVVDYISPMLYPSSFQFGIPGHRNPVAAPYDIVRESLVEAKKRTAGSAVRYRPWLQAFRDYAFDRRSFGGVQMRAQVAGAVDAGASGWLLWSPHNVYSTDGLLPQWADGHK